MATLDPNLYNSFDPSWYFWPKYTSIQMWGDGWGDSFQLIDVYFYKWSGYSTCGTSSAVSSYISGLEGYLLTLNSYYDEKDNSNPIKQYFDYHKSILYTNNVWKSIDVYIEPTEITFLNQTKTIIFETGTIFSEQQSYTSTYLAEMLIYLSPKRFKVEEYLLYQPKNSTRMLSNDMSASSNSNKVNLDQSNTDTSTKETDNGLYNIFNILAKIGGFYSFLNLVFGGVTSYLNRTLMKMEFINQIKSKIASSKVMNLELYKSNFMPNSKIRQKSLIEESKDNRKCK